MTELKPDAQDALTSYLERVRVSLRGTSVDADEVERDVREHIDVALSAQAKPVSAAELNEVLERAVWRQKERLVAITAPARIRRLWNLGEAEPEEEEVPEDSRLAYLCFGLTVLGLVFAPVGGFLLWIPAYLLGRAAHECVAVKGESLGRTFNVDTSGTPRGYVLYDGTGCTIDTGNKDDLALCCAVRLRAGAAAAQ